MENYWKRRWYKRQPLMVRCRAYASYTDWMNGAAATDIYFPYVRSFEWTPDKRVFVYTVEVVRSVKGKLVVEYSLDVKATVDPDTTLLLELRV